MYQQPPPKEAAGYPYQPQSQRQVDPMRTGRRRPASARQRAARRRRRRPATTGCLAATLLLVFLGTIAAFYLLAPGRTNVLLLGIDYTDPGNSTARSDTLILATFEPFRPYVGLLSIPRDLWVAIPGVGENRINTAHFYAESQSPGSGPALALKTVRLNFGVNVRYYARLRFEGFREVVDAMGGVDIELTETMAGYPPGKHHLTGHKALAFVRHRAGVDDFYRMQQGQFLMKAVMKNLLRPANWPRLPAVGKALLETVDTNLPIWLWPRLGMALLRAGPSGIDNRIISRQMVVPFFTDGGADVLAPNWELINPVVKEMFGP